MFIFVDILFCRTSVSHNGSKYFLAKNTTVFYSRTMLQPFVIINYIIFVSTIIDNTSRLLGISYYFLPHNNGITWTILLATPTIWVFPRQIRPFQNARRCLSFERSEISGLNPLQSLQGANQNCFSQLR